jgi:phage terminase large subunit-like protein
VETTERPPRQRQLLHGYGEVVTRFAEEWVVQTKGRWAGHALKLEPWQQDFLDELFLVDQDGRRVYREALLGLARKNGKSTLSSALALYMLLAAGEQGPEVYSAASSKDQARIVFNQARESVEASPRLRDWLTPQKDVILCPANNGVYRVIASGAEKQYGLNPFGVVIDELWAHDNDELYYALTTAQGARQDPLVVSITTAGWDRNQICYRLYDRGKELERRGGLNSMREDSFLFRWYEAPPESSVLDMEGWQAANPSSWITAEDLAREQRRLPENVFRRLHLNQWTEVEDAWIKPYEWDACRGTPAWDPNGESFVGVDVGFKRDSAVFTIGQWYGDKLHLHAKIFLPEEMGPTFGPADIRGHLANELLTDNQLVEVAYDPWMFMESAEILMERGFPMVEFPQGAGRMEPASGNLYELVQERRLVHDGDPELRRQVLAAVTVPTERGGWKISKRKSLERIDAAVSLAMMADRAVTLRYTKPLRRGAAFL